LEAILYCFGENFKTIMKQLILCLTLVILFSKSYSQAKPFSHGGDKRRYTIYLPKTYAQKKEQSFPVVFNLHGGGMTMTEQMFYSGMNKTAEKYGFIVVYPQGIRQDWNVGFDMSYQNGSADIGFINALLDHLLKEYRINPSQVYATGLSRGGFFCHRLAAELPERFAAIASVGGPLPDSVAYFHKKQVPVSVLMIHGNEDQIVKYDGKDSAYLSAPATYAYWRKHNGLSNAKESSRIIDQNRTDSTVVRILETSTKNVSVSLVSIIGGGHTWPGSHPFNIGFNLGKTSQEIDINEVIWKFFSRHKKQ